jgi:hypothetical protein
MGLLDRVRRGALQTDAPAEHGFLQRAAAVRQEPAPVDSFSRSCVERIARLPPSGDSAGTALSILKAYYPFNAAIVLRAVGGEYRQTAGLGSVDAESHRRIPAWAVKSDGSVDASVFPPAAAGWNWLTEAFNVGSSEYRLAVLAENGADWPADLAAILPLCADRLAATAMPAQSASASADLPPNFGAACRRQGASGKVHLAGLDLTAATIADRSGLLHSLRSLVEKIGEIVPAGPASAVLVCRGDIDILLALHRIQKTLDRILPGHRLILSPPVEADIAGAEPAGLAAAWKRLRLPV